MRLSLSSRGGLLLRSCTAFQLGLFSQTFLYQRISQADVIIVLTDKELSPKSFQHHAHRCTIRTAYDEYRSIWIPLSKTESKALPVDHVKIQSQGHEWQKQLLRDVRRAYNGLPYQPEIEQLIAQGLQKINSPWLVDALMNLFLGTLAKLGWQNKKVIRGDSLQRRRYKDESAFLLDLCLHAECERLILGNKQIEGLNRKLFIKNEIALSPQLWKPGPAFPFQDSIIDLMVRHPVTKIEEIFSTNQHYRVPSR